MDPEDIDPGLESDDIYDDDDWLMECSVCGGTGELDDDDVYLYLSFHNECPRCHGTGWC